MDDLTVYGALAAAFAMEGVDAHFTLMGDGNMHWATALAEHGARTIHVRHEHCACSMAMAYSRATGKTGVASVTCGPGLTQTMTALSTAARARIPLVVFAGDSPMNASFYNQAIDQAPFVAAAGGHYIAGFSLARMLEYVREAFYVARVEKRPVVIAVPYDLQKKVLPGTFNYRPSDTVIPDAGPIMPHPDRVAEVADIIKRARRLIVVAGRGALLSGAQAECEELAEMRGGLLATTLPVRGMFDANPFGIGISGGFARDVGREKFAESDVIVAVGASLTYYTADGGKLFPQAKVIQIDERPVGLKDGRKAADIYLRADAKLGLKAVISALDGPSSSDWRTPDLAQRIKDEPADKTKFDIEPGKIDPRDAVAALDRIIPKDWEIVNASGHCSYFSAQMRDRKPENFHVIREFGAIGNGLSYAIGVAVAKPDRQVVLIDGDGGFLMHAQELETIQRHKLKILICILNDGAFGSEIHKMRSDGLDDSGAVFGRGDLGSIARGFGLRGATITRTEGLQDLLDGFVNAEEAEVWDIHISDRVTSPPMRSITSKPH